MLFCRYFVSVAVATVLVPAVTRPAREAAPAPLRFSGYEWRASPRGLAGPGPNHWDPENAWTDKNGWLHLKIAKAEQEWRCAEVQSTQAFGFGRYQFDVIGRLDQLDKNVVLGLFDYPTSSKADGTNEIDIEFSRWGHPAAPAGSYTVWPAKEKTRESSQSFNVSLTGDETTQRFTRGSTEILFQSLYGHQDGDENQFASWDFKPANPETQVPQGATPVHLNLWLFRGKAPSDGKEVEVIVSRFRFTPAAS